MPTLARTFQSASTGRTGLWGSTGDLVLTTCTTPFGSMPTLARHEWSTGNPPWLDAHSRMALAGGWHIALRAMSAHWKHCALYCITRCLTSTTLLSVSTESWLRSIALTPPISPCAPPKKIFWGCLSCLLRCLASCRLSALAASSSFFGRRYSPACLQGPFPSNISSHVQES